MTLEFRVVLDMDVSYNIYLFDFLICLELIVVNETSFRNLHCYNLLRISILCFIIDVNLDLYA